MFQRLFSCATTNLSGALLHLAPDHPVLLAVAQIFAFTVTIDLFAALSHAPPDQSVLIDKLLEPKLSRSSSRAETTDLSGAPLCHHRIVLCSNFPSLCLERCTDHRFVRCSFLCTTGLSCARFNLLSRADHRFVRC